MNSTDPFQLYLRFPPRLISPSRRLQISSQFSRESLRVLPHVPSHNIPHHTEYVGTTGILEWEPRNVHASPSKNRLVHDFTFPVISQTQNIQVWKLSRCRVLQERTVPHLANTLFMDPEISLPPFTTARRWSLSRAIQINFTSPVLTSTKIRFNYPQT